MEILQSTITNMVNNILTTSRTSCPICDGLHIRKNGKTPAKRQRYYCINCGKTFSQFTSTPLSYSKKPIENWILYMINLGNSLTLKTAGKICNISLTTSFYWRHKLLNSLTIQQSQELFTDILHINEVNIPISNKGNHKDKSKSWRRGSWTCGNIFTPFVKIFSFADNNDLRNILPMDNVTMVSSYHIKTYIMPKISKNTTVTARKHKAYLPFAKEKNLKIEEFDVLNKTYKNNKAALNQVLTFKEFLGSRGGVSTKYLTSYARWFTWLFLKPKENLLELVHRIFLNPKAIKIYEIPKLNLRGELS